MYLSKVSEPYWLEATGRNKTMNECTWVCDAVIVRVATIWHYVCPAGLPSGPLLPRESFSSGETAFSDGCSTLTAVSPSWDWPGLGFALSSVGRCCRCRCHCHRCHRCSRYHRCRSSLRVGGLLLGARMDDALHLTGLPRRWWPCLRISLFGLLGIKIWNKSRAWILSQPLVCLVGGYAV